MDTDKYTYRSYLLRLWRRSPSSPANWLVSLEDTKTGERTGFTDLNALLQYLQSEIENVQQQLSGDKSE